MSCFGGLMMEYRYLSIDRFDGANLLSSAYFLSHCHTDHMMGLDSEAFRRRITSRDNIFLYCSEVTKLLLLADQRYVHLNEHISSFSIEEPKIIESVADDGTICLVTVTLLPAAHCPGSVMFLFEGDEGNVLYTGDFRLPKGSAKRMKNLHTAIGTKKSIKSVYVDTTFCTTNSFYIPSREDCLKGLKDVVGDWLKKGASHVVRLNLSAKYGYEYLFRALHDEFGTRIYCKRKSLYSGLPNTYKILTADTKYAKIFACFKKESLIKHWKSIEGEDKLPEKKNILTITLSTMYFTHAALPHEIYHKVGKNHYRFCFSFHSSYGEVCDFVKYLEPESVYANVRPRNGITLNKVAENLVAECKLKNQPQEGAKQLSFGVKPTTPVSVIQPLSQYAKVKSRKRVLSFNSTDGEDSQELFDKFLGKTRKRDNEFSEKVKCISKDNNMCNSSQFFIPEEKDFSVDSSPGSKPPLQSEIEALHVKIALNFGLPPVTR